ncbi:hypothetical protein F5X68DRAFT_76128 [Plectosphaerella plurivora]|uniref:Uncharacterized protein n=1 Tax=Plectosphaerella plurivora TaxID=936078 RepID=A0A9P9ABG1_9PEZI|nr:hypothetical protein F5X68DRAFT_76128 [Plectosphaerella plurivora]
MIPSAVQALFEPVWKFRAHVIELVLIIIAIILTGVFMNLAPFFGRGDIMVIAMGAKSILFIVYQILTERSARFQKWASLKANLILNTIEIPFWLVVIILKFSSINTFCSGTSCGISIVIGLMAIIIFIVVLQVAVISWMDWLHYRKHGFARGTVQTGTPSYAEAYHANAVPK